MTVTQSPRSSHSAPAGGPHAGGPRPGGLLGAIGIAILIAEGVQILENSVPSIGAFRLGGIPLSGIALACSILALGALWANRAGHLHLAVSLATLALVVIALVPLRIRGDSDPQKHRPSHDIPGDVSDVCAKPAPLEAHPGDEITVTFVLCNRGIVLWKDRWFCRSDELNDLDNLQTPECVRIETTRPGGYATVQIRVKVPNRVGPLRAEFKQADGDGEDASWYFNAQRVTSAKLEVTVRR